MSRYPRVTVEFGFQFNISMKAFPISLDIVGKWPTVTKNVNNPNLFFIKSKLILVS